MAFRNHSNAGFAPSILIVRLYFKNMRKFIWLLKSRMYVKCGHTRFTRSGDVNKHKPTCFKNPDFEQWVQEVQKIIHWVGQIHESFKNNAFFERQLPVQQLS